MSSTTPDGPVLIIEYDKFEFTPKYQIGSDRIVFTALLAVAIILFCLLLLQILVISCLVVRRKRKRNEFSITREEPVIEHYGNPLYETANPNYASKPAEGNLFIAYKSESESTKLLNIHRVLENKDVNKDVFSFTFKDMGTARDFLNETNSFSEAEFNELSKNLYVTNETFENNCLVVNEGYDYFRAAFENPKTVKINFKNEQEVILPFETPWDIISTVNNLELIEMTGDNANDDLKYKLLPLLTMDGRENPILFSPKCKFTVKFEKDSMELPVEGELERKTEEEMEVFFSGKDEFHIPVEKAKEYDGMKIFFDGHLVGDAVFDRTKIFRISSLEETEEDKMFEDSGIDEGFENDEFNKIYYEDDELKNETSTPLNKDTDENERETLHDEYLNEDLKEPVINFIDYPYKNEKNMFIEDLEDEENIFEEKLYIPFRSENGVSKDLDVHRVLHTDMSNLIGFKLSPRGTSREKLYKVEGFSSPEEIGEFREQLRVTDKRNGENRLLYGEDDEFISEIENPGTIEIKYGSEESVRLTFETPWDDIISQNNLELVGSEEDSELKYRLLPLLTRNGIENPIMCSPDCKFSVRYKDAEGEYVTEDGEEVLSMTDGNILKIPRDKAERYSGMELFFESHTNLEKVEGMESLFEGHKIAEVSFEEIFPILSYEDSDPAEKYSFDNGVRTLNVHRAISNKNSLNENLFSFKLKPKDTPREYLQQNKTFSNAMDLNHFREHIKVINTENNQLKLNGFNEEFDTVFTEGNPEFVQIQYKQGKGKEISIPFETPWEDLITEGNVELLKSTMEYHPSTSGSEVVKFKLLPLITKNDIENPILFAEDCRFNIQYIDKEGKDLLQDTRDRITFSKDYQLHLPRRKIQENKGFKVFLDDKIVAEYIYENDYKEMNHKTHKVLFNDQNVEVFENLNPQISVPYSDQTLFDEDKGQECPFKIIRVLNNDESGAKVFMIKPHSARKNLISSSLNGDVITDIFENLSIGSSDEKILNGQEIQCRFPLSFVDAKKTVTILYKDFVWNFPNPFNFEYLVKKNNVVVTSKKQNNAGRVVSVSFILLPLVTQKENREEMIMLEKNAELSFSFGDDFEDRVVQLDNYRGELKLEKGASMANVYFKDEMIDSVIF